MRASVILLGLPLLAAGARHAHPHVHRHAHAHRLVDRAIYTEVVTVTEATTVMIDALNPTSTQINNGPSSNPTSTGSPVVSLTPCTITHSN